MAVYTEVGPEELDGFLAAYDLGAPVSIKGIAEGVENSNYLLITERGRFILTLYERRVAEADLPFFVGLMDHLADAGLSCPRPVRDRAGAALQRLAGRPAAIVTFLDGVAVRRPAVAHCAALGEGLAALHEAGQGFALTRPNALSLPAWRPLLEAALPRADEVAPGLAPESLARLAAIEAEWPDGLPRGTIHADLFPDNAFFLRERLSGIIDFYFACTDALAYDLAVCLNAWCFEPDGAFNLTKGQALLNAYARRRPLTPAEAEALPVLARGAAIRFMLTRLVDWLNVPPGALVRPKDPLEYLAKLRFHAGVTRASGYGLPA